MDDVVFDKIDKKSYNNSNESADGFCRSNDLLTMKEAERYLRIKRTLLYKLVNSCELVTLKIGRRRFVYKEDLDSFINKKRAEFTAWEI